MGSPTFEGDDGTSYTLAEVMETWLFGDPIPLRPPSVAELASWAATAGQEDASKLVSIVTRYPSFKPSLSEERSAEALLAMLTSSTDDAFPFEIALALDVRPDAESAVASFLDRAISARCHVARRERFVTFLSYLLDDRAARPAVLAVMLRRAQDDDEGVRSIVEQMALDRDVDRP